MKKTICIFLILILFLQIGGVLIIYKLELCFVQYKMSIELEKSSSKFELLRLPFKQYKTNLIDDKELSLNGKMYDIKTVNFLGDSVEILAINDLYEEKILEHIKGFIKHLGNFSHNTPIQFTFLVLLNYIIPDGTIKFHSPLLNLCLFCYSDNNYFSKKPDTGSPPPRCF